MQGTAQMKNPVLPGKQDQASCLAELGDRLCQGRKKQSISLEQVSSQTLIPTRLLRAIEHGDLAHLPEPVYIQGFIKRYADAIGMDGTELANAFPTETLRQSSPRSLRMVVQAQLRPIHLYALYVLLVMGAVSGLSYVMNRSTLQTVSRANLPLQPAPAIPAGPTQAGNSLNGPVQPSVTPSSPVAVASPNVPQKPVRVELKLVDQSWLRVVADGKTAFEGVLPQGSQRTWIADKEVTLRAGNAGGVVVRFNDSQPQPMGQPGAVEERTFAPNSQLTQAQENKPESSLTATGSTLF
jgi:cytoskeletal protein RodZ